MGKLIILTGAPESDRLDWTSPDLLHTFLDPIARFAQLQPQTIEAHPPTPTAQQQQQQQQQDKSVLDLAAWRSLPLHRTHVPTGFSQQHDMNLVRYFPSSADFLTTTGISSEAASQGEDSEEDGELLAEFYEHSLAVHDDLASSQLVAPSQGQGQSRSVAGAGTPLASDACLSKTSTSLTSEKEEEEEEGEEEECSTTFLAATATRTPPRGPAGRRGNLDDSGHHHHHLSDLEDIPPAPYLVSILPQTVTVTLIVGIISIAAPRTVKTRYGTAKTLVEVLVGDETKSGFSVTFWLGPAAGGGVGDGGVLAGLRGQDVVLMQNVALNTFRGKVYGGSLRRDLTRVFLLYRGRRVDEQDVGGHYSASDLGKAGRGGKQQQQHPQLEKTRRVRDWVLKFVGGGPGVVDAGPRRSARTRKAKERAPRRDWNQPPPLDSQ